MPKTLTIPNTYKALVAKVSRELEGLEFLIKRSTAETYWKIGRYIHEHLLAHEKRAEYGATLFVRLAKDVDRNISTLQRSVQFYRTYPISAERRELSWNHYKSLITIKDEKERKKLEQKIIRQDWDVTKLQEYLSVKRELTAPERDGRPIPQLTFTHGKLHTYQIVKSNQPLADKSDYVLDLGFRLQHVIPSSAIRFKENEIVELIFKEDRPAGIQKIEASKDELFTYQARVEKVIDGDTLLTSFDFGLDFSISQKLRLRGIDCPEIDTEEGKKAKRFVESRLKGCEFIIVKTYKDRADKFDRYLADVFYKAEADDSSNVAREGGYLNQELLNERLAVKYV